MSDRDKYEALQARMRKAHEQGQSALYMELWRELEALKNKHDGMIPEPEALCR